MTDTLATAMQQRRQKLHIELDGGSDANPPEKRGIPAERPADLPAGVVNGAQLSARFAEFEQGLKTLQRINDEMRQRLERLS